MTYGVILVFSIFISITTTSTIPSSCEICSF
jgi:hypothetical protein